ncbi:zinc fingers and homeoboxes protein 3 [Pelodytes ibericus]
MASKRKSTTPCMIPLKTLALERGTELAEEFKEKTAKEDALVPNVTGQINSNEMNSNGHQNLNGDSFFCKYCNFGSHDTGIFVEHMNSKHLDFRDDPSYVCIVCSFLVKEHEELEAHNVECHGVSAGLTWSVAKHESYTVVEQSVGDQNHDQEMTEHHANHGVDDFSDISITKTPIMKIMKNKMETKKIVTIKDSGNKTADKVEKKGHIIHKNGSIIPVSKSSTNIVNSTTIVNGSILGTVPVLPAGVTQLVSINPTQPGMQSKLSTIIAPVLTKHSAMQKSQNASQSHTLPNSKSLPKVMIPLSSIPTYNTSMDSNCFLKNSFNKFPYPTKAELCYLTVVTKYPEEQIKIWFTAQRLKQGISWSPEEIEDSRKKMFTTVIQSIPQPMPQPTITVLNAPLVANANNVQHIIQATLPGQIVGQPQGAGGLLVTQPILTNGIQGTPASVSLTVTSIPTHHTTTTQARVASPVGKVISNPQHITTTSSSMASQTLFDSNFARSKKSRQQLGALKNSFYKNQFPTQTEVTRLTKITGLSTRDVRKWFSDKRYHWRNKTSFAADNSDGMVDSPSDMFSLMKEPDIDYPLPPSGHTPSHTSRRQSWNQTPDFTPTKYKERAPEQIKALESSFSQNNFPSEEEVNRLRTETKMTRREIDGWFSEKRKKLAEEHKKMEIEKDDEEEDENYRDDMEVSVSESSTAENSSPLSNERKVNPIKINLKDLRVTESSDNMETSSVVDDDLAADGGSRPSTPLKNRSHTKKTAQQRDLLKQTFVHTHWPSSQEYDDLVEQTGLPRVDIVRWFGDCRYSLKNGQLKWYERYKTTVDAKNLSPHPLMEYYKQHHMIEDHDLEGLCEKTGMTADDVKAWFVVKQEEENGVALDVPVDDPLSVEKPITQQGTCNASSEVAESSEGLVSNAPNSCSDSTQTAQQSITQTGKPYCMFMTSLVV